MSSLQELYGDTYKNDFIEHNRQYVAGLIISNLAALNIKEVKHDYSVLYDQTSNELPEKWFQYIKTRTEKMNSFLIIDRIRDKSAIPRLIPEDNITYLRIIDTHRKQVYIVFITPFIMDTF